MNSMMLNNMVKRTLLLIGSLAVCLTFLLLFKHNDASAHNGGNLISDAVFLDSNSMTKSEIQQFLVNKGSGLATRSYELQCYSPGSTEYQWYTAAGASCSGTIPASEIIYYAAQIYGVNPQVILATLQKEQSLITSSNPTSWQLNQAMGYGCPTTGGCGASTFAYQVDSGTWVLRYHFERARGNNTWWNNNGYTCGNASVFYNPGLIPDTDVTFIDEDGVSYRTVRIANAATASLYCYTPHTYNNPQGLYGREPFGTVGRYYSGSYNFVYWFEIWFGATVKESVVAVVYDGNTDNSGETASIGFRLSSRPASDVVVPIEIKSSENARIISSLTEIHFNRQNWNEPKQHRIFIAGKYNPDQTGTIHYKLDLRQPQSTDPSFSNLPATNYPDVFLAHQMSEISSRSVWRVHDNNSDRSIFTASQEERSYYLSLSGWEDKGYAFSYCSAGDRTIARMRNGNERMFVPLQTQEYNDAHESGFELERVDFATSTQGSIPIYWFYNSTNGDHFYTPDSRAMIGYESKGVAFYACEPDVLPVYRMYNSNTRSFFYTTSARERKDWAREKGFSNYQGNAFYVCETGNSIYRLHRPSTNGYIYVDKPSDVEFLEANNGFVYEGKAFFLCAGSTKDVYSIYTNNSNKIHLYTVFESERDERINSGATNQGALFKSK